MTAITATTEKPDQPEMLNTTSDNPHPRRIPK
jgi:hypothetical protein